MKLRKKVKRTILLFILTLVAVGGIIVYKNLAKNDEVTEAKIVNEIKKYGYKLKDTKPQKYKDMFSELKEILEATKVDEEEYVRKISEMFIYDFFSLDDKTAKTDIGGVDFVYPEIADNFLQNAQDTYYKYVESNIYDNRNQSLPVVSEITIKSVEQEEYAYGDKNDPEAYKVIISWDYEGDSFSEYQKEAELIFIHDDIKLCLVELQ